MEDGIKKTGPEQTPSVLSLLLEGALPDVRRERPRKQYEVKRLSKVLGQPAVFTLQGLPYGRVHELQRLTEDLECHILLDGCVDPSFKDPALMAKFKAATPLDAIQAMLLPGEITDLSRAIERLTGYRQTTIREIKNGSGRAGTRT